MPASRLLSVLLLLQSRGRVSARAIANELNVSVRTAYRDLARLQSAGVPVYAEPGRGGGYQLLDGYRTRLTGMSEGEARALFFAGLPGPAADLGLAADVTAARLKLLAALPTGLREEASRVATVSTPAASCSDPVETSRSSHRPNCARPWPPPWRYSPEPTNSPDARARRAAGCCVRSREQNQCACASGWGWCNSGRSRQPLGLGAARHPKDLVRPIRQPASHRGPG